MEKKMKFSKTSIAAMVLCVLIVIAFLLPFSSGAGLGSFDLSKAYNILDIIGMIFHPSLITGSAAAAFTAPFVICCIGIFLVFAATIALFVLTFLQKNIGVRRVLAVCILLTSLVLGMQFNSTLTAVAKDRVLSTGETVKGNNFYEVYPEFKMVIKTRNGSVNSWARPLGKFKDALSEVFTDGEDITAMSAKIDELVDYVKDESKFNYNTKTSVKRKGNAKVFAELQEMIPVERQEEVFQAYFKSLTKSVSNVKSTFGIGYILIVLLGIVLCGACYSERSAEGYRNNGVNANCMFVGVMMLLFAGALLYPTIVVSTDVTATTGMPKTSLLMVFLMLPKLFRMDSLLAGAGAAAGTVETGRIVFGVLLLIASFVCMMVFIVWAAKKQKFKMRRWVAVAACTLFLVGGLLANGGCGQSGIALDAFFYLFVGLAIAAALIPFTVYIDKERFKVFSIVNVILFILICAFIIVPLWKVFVDSIDANAGYGMRMWPEQFTLLGYKQIITNVAIRRPFLISVLTTVAGTFLGLLLSTLGAYVLIQFEMPGRNFLANMLLFTMIFQGGMIPTYLVLVNLHLTETLWAVILLPAINVYNLVLMRNFFEGIPKSLFESASIDGCSPMGTFIKIVLPLSKAALASIGLMFAVSFWNDYTNYKLYITNTRLHNFQMKLRAMIFSSDMPTAVGVSENTIQNAAIITAILPFMIIYPFCQKYFVKGVNIGAVKE